MSIYLEQGKAAFDCMHIVAVQPVQTNPKGHKQISIPLLIDLKLSRSTVSYLLSKTCQYSCKTCMLVNEMI